MESNIPYIEIIPENSDVVTGPDSTYEETSFNGRPIYSLHCAGFNISFYFLDFAMI